MKQSGITLAWDFFHEGKECPEFMRYIEDKDIWRWAMVDSRAFTAAMALQPLPPPGQLTVPGDFEPWLALSGPFSTALNVDRISEEGTQGLLRQGQSLVSYEDSIIAQHLSRAATRRLRKFDVIAAVVNATVLSSEIGNAMMQEGVMKEDVGLALICSYSVTHNNWRISARSMFPRRGVDVSEIAQAYGGGGHRAAAGFCVRPSFVVLPNRHMYNQVQVADLESLFTAE